jgi:hypothetical protein
MVEARFQGFANRRTPMMRLVLSLMFVMVAVSGPVVVAAAPARTPDALPDCFAALARLSGTSLTCQHRAWLTDQERADLNRLTQGLVRDARCTVTVSVDRALVDEAVAASDRVFTAPPQPVTCQIETSQGVMPISGTFSPRVEFRQGFAVAASPGLGSITGVNGYLAWPAVEYVNRSAAIGEEMVRMINAMRANLGSQRAQR